jgi:lipopolysaccharide biosynthesis regulator YciM
VRATILLGRIEMDQEEWRKAAETLIRVEQLDYAYFPVVLPYLVKCHQRTGSESKLRAELQRIFEKRRGRAELLTLTDLMQAEDGVEIALSFLSTHLQEHASLAGIERLIALDLKTASSKGDHSGTLRVIRPLIDQLLERRAAYQCGRCGFTAKELHWQCPGCKNWHSIKPT